MRALVVVCVLAATASAQSLPGTADDPVAALHIMPSVVDAPLQPFAVRGGTPEETQIFVDGFELPRLQHVLAQRSVIPESMLLHDYLVTTPDVTVARPSAVMMSLQPRYLPASVTASTYDVALRSRAAGLRASVSQAATDATYFDGQLRVYERINYQWTFDLSLISALDRANPTRLLEDHVHQQLTRLTAATTYKDYNYHDGWAVTLSASTLLDSEQIERGNVQHLDHDIVTADTRADLTRSWRSAVGLSRIEWRIGEQTNIAHHDLDFAWPRLPREGSPQPEHAAPEDVTTRFKDTLWTPDAALFSSIGANLSRDIRATTGLRLDYFGRGRDLATEPRGELHLRVAPRTSVALSAGAYRRAPEHDDELLTKLNPERTTQVMVHVWHRHQALTLGGSAYYAQRSRLVIRDADGILSNTGLGTSYGVELSAQLSIRGLLVWATGSLSRASRKNFLFDRERPSEFDQPLRANVLASYRMGRWRFGGRVQVASGLPTTAIQRALYDADRDVYEPIYAMTYADRLPMRYELDLRVDRTLRPTARVQLDAFADVALSPSTIDYRYSYDYTERTRVRIPIAPYVGLRGTL